MLFRSLHVQQSIATFVSCGIALFYMGQAVKMNYLYAGLCLMEAVDFIFKG